ncbi:Retrovirus-related Pol poly from transposon [Pelobates cultripes]|uniref:Retrovirus-related Pol poly from transposon n=1 Tax=Pelobates cultripes TaxID=61616 RepID=A0AAD1TAX8_PELCU|nr:Retrovirus-related Pol poly from transposon [Pelobates cultripes]
MTVLKQDGTTQFCMDYRRLNNRIITDAYPIPRVDERLDSIARGHYLTTIDRAQGGYPQLAFVIPLGVYQPLLTCRLRSRKCFCLLPVHRNLTSFSRLPAVRFKVSVLN